MSVTSTIYNITYIGNGVQLAFPIPFYFMALSDIAVTVNGVAQGYTTNYTISGSSDLYGSYPSGGTVNFVLAPTGTIYIVRNTPKTSIWSFVDAQPLTADAINHSLDRLLLIDQEEFGGFLGMIGGPPISGAHNVGDWYQVMPAIPGGPFGIVCTTAGNPGTWNFFGNISLL